jgi:hypothetical protein
VSIEILEHNYRGTLLVGTHYASEDAA